MARYSGLKPHTIRMWEQRYQALQPHRSEGQTRYYDNSQLRRLLNIVSLIGHEHKVATLCGYSDKQLFEMIKKVIDFPPPALKSDTWLVFTREGENHEIGILLANYLIRLSGRKVVYLGCDVPYESLLEAVNIIRPTALLVFIVHKEDPVLSSIYFNDLEKKFAGKKIYIAGQNGWMSKLKLAKKMHVVNSVEDLENELK